MLTFSPIFYTTLQRLDGASRNFAGIFCSLNKLYLAKKKVKKSVQKCTLNNHIHIFTQLGLQACIWRTSSSLKIVNAPNVSFWHIWGRGTRNPLNLSRLLLPQHLGPFRFFIFFLLLYCYYYCSSLLVLCMLSLLL